MLKILQPVNIVDIYKAFDLRVSLQITTTISILTYLTTSNTSLHTPAPIGDSGPAIFVTDCRLMRMIAADLDAGITRVAARRYIIWRRDAAGNGS